EYYLLKHVSHFVLPGAKRLNTTGSFENVLAFVNPDNSIVCVLQNEASAPRKITIEINGKIIQPMVEANSFNTFILKNKPKFL
ncbi:MAG: glycoside hydrolase family 30 beta sandwich domain-containing protein, partial [Bacteroidota bacterium]|nr:glycoside hydrolase family 30 beta sandwich domain-containing protein [Bacteroidota bacterium]